MGEEYFMKYRPGKKKKKIGGGGGGREAWESWTKEFLDGRASFW